MKKDNLIWWILGGAGALTLYYYYKNKNSVKASEVSAATILVEESAKYSNPLLAQYNIMMPVDIVTKKQQAKKEQLTQGRYAIQPQRIQAPLYI
jgi:hypothetical protein